MGIFVGIFVTLLVGGRGIVGLQAFRGLRRLVRLARVLRVVLRLLGGRGPRGAYRLGGGLRHSRIGCRRFGTPHGWSRLGVGVVDQSIEIELENRAQRLEVVHLRLVDDLHDAPFAVEQAENLVDLIGDLGELLGELVVVHLEAGFERRQALEELAPLVDAPHSFHEESLGTALDLLVSPHGSKLEGEVPEGPRQETVHRFLSLERPEVRIDDLPVTEEDLPRVGFLRQMQNPGFPTEINSLQQVDDGHVLEGAREGRSRVRSTLEVVSRLALQEHPDAGDDFLDENRLRQEVVDAELETSNLVFDGGSATQKNERDGSPFGFGLHLFGKRVSVYFRHIRVGNDQIRRFGLYLGEGIDAIHGGGHVVARFAQAHLEHAQAPGVVVHDEQSLLGHWSRPLPAVSDRRH